VCGVIFVAAFIAVRRQLKLVKQMEQEVASRRAKP
jgi:hypothetical protein